MEVREQLFFATQDLTQQYTSGSLNTKHWEEKLLSFMYSEKLDGRNRYNAFVRLVFLYFNYKEYDKAKKIFDQVDEYFKQGQMYSRRILFNYYANRVILHSNLDDLDKAEYYAYLSVKQENSDRLFYLNNLIAILLKKDKNKGIKKLCGVIKLDTDPVVLQKQWRDEWM
jgi:tetratricopeptide (TPR) repeat protein